MSGLYLGIDTSNYTTSIAVSDDTEIIAQVQTPLAVKHGERGLRQSDAVFAHTVNLPELFSKLEYSGYSAVGVSSSPRDNEGSYMPCFIAGVSAASSASSSLNAPLYRFSHQRGHIAAALYSVGREELLSNELIAFHVSGGTTEILHLKDGKIGLIGGTEDLSCGKLIDRVGVMLGLDFPCGMALSELARFPDDIKGIKLSVNDLSFNISGIENKASDLISSGAEREYVASYVIAYVYKLIKRLTEVCAERYPSLPLIYSGGVMSNHYIRAKIENEFGGLFAEPRFSRDNAAGIARLAMMQYNRLI